MKRYRHRIEIEAGGTFFEIIDAKGLAVAATFFFPDEPEGKVRAETRARIIADALNAYGNDDEICVESKGAVREGRPS